MQTKIISTPIKDLVIYFNKTVGDQRGVFCDMAPGGTDNPIFHDGIKNISASIATQKLVARGGHYHFRLKENIYTLSGTALWYFYDFRPDSPTYQTGYVVILGFDPPKQNINFPTYTISQGSMAQVDLPAGIYHVFWPISDEKVVVAHTGSHDYDPNDYARPTIEEVPGTKEISEELQEKFNKTTSQKISLTPISSIIKNAPKENLLIEEFSSSKNDLTDLGTNKNTVNEMKAIVTAGRNIQLRPLTHTTNKHLIPIANKPMIFYAIEHLVESGFKEIGIIISPEDDELPQIIGNGERWNIKIEYIPQVGGLRGLGHVIKIIKDYKNGTWLNNFPFILYLGDNIIKADLGSLIRKFKKEQLNCLLTLAKIKDPQRFGVPEFRDGKIIKVEERPLQPKSEYAVAGLYIYDQSVFKVLENLKPSIRGDYEISDVHTYLIENNYRVGWQELESWWKDRGKPEDILEGNCFTLEKIEAKIDGHVDHSVIIQGKVSIGAGSKILGRTIIRGPVSIGQRTTIKDSYIGPYTSIGHQAEIHNAEIEYSLITDNTHIYTPSRITNSLIGKNSFIIPASESSPSGFKIIAGENSIISI